MLAAVTFGTVWLVGHNSGHNAYLASHLVSVTVAPGDQLPASSTDHMVIVSPDIATTKASQAMATGIAGQRNYSTYLQLGPATLQYVDGRMWYVFPLEFDGAGNKARLHAIEPGYIMVSAEDPNAVPVEHYDGAYSMIVSLGGGQGSEPDRWAYSHGYSGYLLDDPTLEINDQGLPYYTVTLLSPRLGWTFFAPVGVLVINAHSGQITRYALGDVPSWVDRVYSQQMAMTIANWYGEYSQAGFQGSAAATPTASRCPAQPVMVYTGAGHPVWRMLLTSYNSDNSVSKIVEMNAASGAMTDLHAAAADGHRGPGHPGIRQRLGYRRLPGQGRPLPGRRPDPARHLRPPHLDGHLRAGRLEPELRRHRLRRRVRGNGEQRGVRQQQVGRAAELPRPTRHRGHRQRDGARAGRPVPDDNRARSPPLAGTSPAGRSTGTSAWSASRGVSTSELWPRSAPPSSSPSPETRSRSTS